jgi:type IV pilus assembly protein PilY1
VTYPDPSSATNPHRSCAKAILNFALGQDLLNTNGGGVNNRLYMLGDIYHSTPIDIGPPISESFCQFNTRRCTPTLFNGIQGNQTNSTSFQPLEFPSTYYTNTGTLVTGGGPGPIDAYQAYVNSQTFAGQMPQVRVFGANDGWVHAIQFACYAGLDASTNTPIYYGGPGHGLCTRTVPNGTELWAFIPPDLLPKLPQLLFGKHQTFVDGTAMVRDIYSGPTSIKRLQDFHTVAIFGERNGGNRWMGLDVTDPTAPAFRWYFPQVGSVDELRSGLSWGDYLPGSSPIGPVRVASGITGSPTYNGTPFHETWIVALPGGYDHYGIAGHGLWMLNAWTGQKVWEAWGQAGQDFSYGGLPSLANWGTSESQGLGSLPNNGFFDTMVIADTGGTLWAGRMNDVGTYASSANANGETLVGNWALARAFRQADADDTGNTHTYKMQNRVPFFGMPSLGRMADSGFLRAFIGSGDRGNVADQYLGTCSSSNLLACGKQGVVAMNERDRDLGASTVRGAFVSYDGTANVGLTVGGTLTYASASATACTPSSQSLNGCLKSSLGQVNTAATPSEPQQACVNTATGLSCSTLSASGLTLPTAFDPNTGQNGASASVYTTSGNGYYGGFYAVTMFKPSPSSRQIFTSTTASTYDAARTTENSATCSASAVSGLCNLYPNGLLSSYAFPETATSFRAGNSTDGTTDGYYFRYPNIDEKTSGNTLLAQGCVLWSSVQPTSPCDSDADCAAFSVDQAGAGNVVVGQCNTAAHECLPSTQCNVVGGSSAGHIYQINAGLGTADCALVGQSMPRVTFGTILPPPPPQSVALVNPRGSAIQYAVVTPAGLSGTMLQPRAGGGQLFRPYYSIEVPQTVHSCRHTGTCY